MVWPTWPETSRTAIFVAIMMMILAVFFLGVDPVFGWVVRCAARSRLTRAGIRVDALSGLTPGAGIRGRETMAARWYIIHAYSGFENKVRDSIIAEAERLGLRKRSRRSKCRPRP